MTETTGGGSGRGEVSSLRARLRVQPSPNAGCALLSTVEKETSVRQSLTCSDGECEDRSCECHAEVGGTEEPAPRFVSNKTSDACVCPIFNSHACASNIEEVTHGELVFAVTFKHRDELRSIVSGLRETGATVRLQQLVQLDPSTSRDVVETDDTSITEKQREAIQTAYELGYYENPREADLGDIADELDITKSAVSQRLNAVSSKLVVSHLQTQTDAQAPKSSTMTAQADD